MAKAGGLGDNAYVGGYDLSGDVQALGTIGGGPAAMTVTAINASGVERIGGLRDGRMEYVVYLNDAAGQAHPVLSALPTTDVVATYCRGTTLGDPAACTVAKQIGYDATRGTDGSLTMDVSAQSNAYGLGWGRQLTAGVRTDTGATAGTGVDFGTGSTSFGLQAWLHVFSFTGTDATITIESSSDNGVGDAFAAVTGGVFTAVTTGPTSERIVTARDATIERYLRVTTSTTGGFTSLGFAVVVERNDTLVNF